MVPDLHSYHMLAPLWQEISAARPRGGNLDPNSVSTPLINQSEGKNRVEMNFRLSYFEREWVWMLFVWRLKNKLKKTGGGGAKDDKWVHINHPSEATKWSTAKVSPCATYRWKELSLGLDCKSLIASKIPVLFGYYFVLFHLFPLFLCKYVELWIRSPGSHGHVK